MSSKNRVQHYKRILLLLRVHGCNMNANCAFFSRDIALQIYTPENWNKIKHYAVSYIFESA